MFNLIKAQQYRTLRDNATYIIICVGIVFYVFTTLMTLMDGSSKNTDAGHFFLMAVTSQAIVGNLLIMALTSLICGSDLVDRTMNFELLDGSKRSAVFFSRFIVALCWSLGVIYAIILIPMIFLGVFKGWGDILSVAGFAKRMALLLFPYIRIVALYTALTFILGDHRAVFAIGFIFCQFEMLADMMIQEITKLPTFVRSLLSAPAVSVMLDVDNIGFDYVDAKDISVVKDSMTAADNAVCAGICIAATVIALVAGLKIFKKKDLK